MARRVHVTNRIMELAIAIILLAVGLMLEYGPRVPITVRARDRRRR